MTMKRVSELITIDEIKTWNNNDTITISAGTGVGKSYFIKNILYAFAKENNRKILFLIHRNNCINQFQKEIEKDNKTDIIHIKTYQHYESKIKNKKIVDLSEYQYIVCDEFHYFMSDSAFNITTDMSLNMILNTNNSIRIFMSATGNDMIKYINNIKNIETKDYNLSIDYNFIKDLRFYNTDNTLDTFAHDCIKSNDKGIFFIQSAKKAYEFYIKYKDYALFNCSKSNKDYYKYVDEDKINDMLENQYFNEKMLITTTCMDAGVNIIDDKVKHIVCDVKDIGTLIQCIGRKRRQKDTDTIYLYLKSISNKSLGGMKSQLNLKYNKAKFLKEHNVKEYLKEYPRANSKDYYNIVYDEIIEAEDKCTKKINELMFFKVINDLVEIDTMLSYGKYGYNQYINCHLFNRKKEIYFT